MTRNTHAHGSGARNEDEGATAASATEGRS